MSFAPDPFTTIFLFVDLSNNAPTSSGLSTTASSTIVPSSTFYWVANSTSCLQYIKHKKYEQEISIVLSQCYW